MSVRLVKKTDLIQSINDWKDPLYLNNTSQSHTQVTIEWISGSMINPNGAQVYIQVGGNYMTSDPASSYNWGNLTWSSTKSSNLTKWVLEVPNFTNFP